MGKYNISREKRKKYFQNFMVMPNKYSIFEAMNTKPYYLINL